MTNNQNTEFPEIGIGQVAKKAILAFISRNLLVLLGKPGVGKTQIGATIYAALVEALTTGVLKDHAPSNMDFSYGFDSERDIVNLTSDTPVQSFGFGVSGPWDPDPDAKIDMKYSVPDWLPTFDRVGYSFVLLVLDEFTNWQEEIKGSALGCMTPFGFAKKWGPHVLGPNVFVVVTGNRREDNVRLAKPLSPAFATRSMTFVVKAVIEETLEYLKDNGLGMSGAFTLLDFLRKGKNDGGNGTEEYKKHYAPDPGKDGMPYPTPRGWEAVARLTMPDSPMFTGEVTNDDGTVSAMFNQEDIDTALIGVLGPDTGATLATWIGYLEEAVNCAKSVLSGSEEMPEDFGKAYQIGMAAFRQVRKEFSKLSNQQRKVAVKQGDADGLVDNVLSKLDPEYCRHLYEMAIREDADGNQGIPLDLHPKEHLISGMSQ